MVKELRFPIPHLSGCQEFKRLFMPEDNLPSQSQCPRGMLDTKEWLILSLHEQLSPEKAMFEFLCFPKVFTLIRVSGQKFQSHVQNSVLQIVRKYHFVFFICLVGIPYYINTYKNTCFTNNSFTVFLCTPALHRSLHMRTISDNFTHLLPITKITNEVFECQKITLPSLSSLKKTQLAVFTFSNNLLATTSLIKFVKRKLNFF